MKKQLFFFSACLLSFFTNAQTTSNDLTERKLRGKVKSVSEVKYRGVEKFGEIEKGEIIETDYRTYNKEGNETEHQEENVEKKWGKTTKTFRYEKGKPVEIRKETKEKVTITKIKYNDQGRIAIVDFIDDKGVLEQRQIYRYDGELVTQVDAYNGDGSYYSKTVYAHNAKKQLVKQERYDESKKLFDLKTYAYDNDGKVSKETDIDFWPKATDTIVRTYRYNQKKQKVEETYSKANGKSSDHFTDNSQVNFEYNEQGDVVSESVFLFEEKTVYTYDKYNNWTKAVTTSGSAVEIPGLGKATVEIVERQIKYY